MDDCKNNVFHWLFFGINLFFSIAAISALQKQVMDSNVGCLPSTQKLIASSFFDKYSVLDDSKFEVFLTKDFQLVNSPSGLPNYGRYYTPKLSISGRDLDGEGSHRQLVTSLAFEVDSAPFKRDFQYCEAIVVERLPLGIFADVFQLQRLVQRGVFSDVAVFGDTNLELPSALSNRSVVEIHMNIWHQMLSKAINGPDLEVVLPLHVRYPPLGSNHYWNVHIGALDLLMSCTPTTSSPEGCSTLLFRFHPSNATDVVWKIPRGNGEHTFAVSIVTFACALVSALLLVYSAVSSLKKDIKAA